MGLMVNPLMGLNTVNMNLRFKDSGYYAYMPSILKICLTFATLQILFKILTCLGRISHYRHISPVIRDWITANQPV